MKKLLLATGMLAAALTATVASLGFVNAGPDETDKALNYATALHVVLTCVKPTINGADPQDQKYAADATWVVANLANGLSDLAQLAANHAVLDGIDRIGKAEFCRIMKPTLDDTIQIMRKKYPEELERFRQQMQRRP